jgi:dTDP-4-dehydrorhamnose reductase
MQIILLGASGIIGREIDRALASQHEIMRAGRNGEVKVDYTDSTSVKAMFEQVGKFDALVAAVGGDSAFKPYDQLTAEDFNFGFQ